MTKCAKCGNQNSHLKNEVSTSPYIRPRLVCLEGCKPFDRIAQILDSIVAYVDNDENVFTQEAREAWARVNAAIARQDRRLGSK